MKKKILVPTMIMFAVTTLFFLLNTKQRGEKDYGYSNNTIQNTENKEKVEKAIGSQSAVSVVAGILRKSKVLPEGEVFNDKTGLSPLPDDYVIMLEGEKLQERLQELDIKLENAIAKHSDLPAIPDWYNREREYLEEKYFATIGKSRYETKMTKELKEKYDEYLDLLKRVKESGKSIEGEKLAEIKEKILGG
jgi:hypothetical protein